MDKWAKMRSWLIMEEYFGVEIPNSTSIKFELPKRIKDKLMPLLKEIEKIRIKRINLN